MFMLLVFLGDNMVSIFEVTTRVNTELLYQRNDTSDVRLGETVLTDPKQYDAADVVLLGCPQDEGVRRNKGRVGAKDAPNAIRRCLYRYVAIEGLAFFDLGNTIIQDTLEATHDAHREIVLQVLRDGKNIVVLGGGNDVSYPDCSALAMETQGDILAFNIDAHFDVRVDEPRNSGTPYRQLLEEGHIKPENFAEIGSLLFANSDNYREYLNEKAVRIYDIHQVNEIGIPMLVKNLLREVDFQAIFWGLDMDVVRAADAPGVSAVNPIGITGMEFAQVGSLAGFEARTRIFEITEVNPTYDIDERTCRLAAAAVWNFLASVAANISEGLF
jgi:formiminoglutamase